MAVEEGLLVPAHAGEIDKNSVMGQCHRRHSGVEDYNRNLDEILRLQRRRLQTTARELNPPCFVWPES